MDADMEHSRLLRAKLGTVWLESRLWGHYEVGKKGEIE